ncbi:hypothetical protein PIB30_040479 [Stylosanthes scabra]|uniref:Uncharacterized protein n=1 Tax=Stylosanthes scabra TaxID=79078 RepID=A0ABU6YC05_9FABA|nr:hypothetical protein [Stylosanthes scabra]
MSKIPPKMIKNPNLKLKSSFTPNSQLPCPSPNPLALVLPLTRSRPSDVRKLIVGAVEASSEPPSLPRCLPVERRVVLNPVKPRAQLGGGSSAGDDDCLTTKAFGVCEVEFVCVYHGMIWRLISYV